MMAGAAARQYQPASTGSSQAGTTIGLPSMRRVSTGQYGRRLAMAQPTNEAQTTTASE
jgi:hypothetical protein